jgi:small subunit ribosomal protein S18
MKQDYFSANNIKYIDYKDIEILKKFLNPNGKIVSHKRSGVTSKNQRALSNAIKHARFLGLLPWLNKRIKKIPERGFFNHILST